jgi:hypothetical protein
MIDPQTGYEVRILKQSDAGPFYAWLLGPGGIFESYVACLESDEVFGPFEDLEVARRRFEIRIDPLFSSVG